MFGRIQNPLVILYSIPAIIVAFTLHEFMHAYVAVKLGDPTPERNGRLTLNPIAHLDFVGLLMVLLMGFGWAKPVMINPSNFQNRKKGKVLVSIAGPLTNLALAFIFYAILYFSGNAIYGNEMAYSIFMPFITINLMLFAFNMIPIPPLDGFSLLEIFIHPSKFKTLGMIRQYGFMVLILLSFVGVLGIYMRFVYSAVGTVFIFIFSLIDKFIGLF